MELWIGLGIIGLVILSGILIYNSLVSLRVRSGEAWADIQTQLKRRHDLIPNLVETVKGYMSHERGVLEKVTELRGAAMGASGPAAAAQAEGQLTQALRSLFAVAENYPQLRATENFMNLQQNLGQIEEQIQLSRRYYNAVVRDLNTRIQSFPSNLIASTFGFMMRDFFELETPEEGKPVQVRF
ncbi:MAG: LemA family protein [Candidatus Rokubacteria bacterium]|nr:LemA family protein [Candidatus Rokubacteria bacterium]